MCDCSTTSSFGFDDETIIYFTVDFDALDGDVTLSILPYFRAIYEVFKRTNTTYKIGIDAPRNVCSRVSANKNKRILRLECWGNFLKDLKKIIFMIYANIAYTYSINMFYKYWWN